MKKINKIFDHKWASTLLWIVLIIVVWEIAATVVAANNRSPENILPHLYQILAAAFSTDKVSQGMTATMVVLTSAERRFSGRWWDFYWESPQGFYWLWS